ncbi:MAG: hypothetical protein ACSLFQ_17035 [Thermoanaerobaculia bacterium]
MSGLAAVVGRLDDAMSPVVVKELRQAVRGRFIVMLLMGFLATQVITMGIALLVGADKAAMADTMAMGRTTFLWLLGILLGTCLLCIPLYTGIRLGVERSDSDVDLLFITTIRPRSIIFGKLTSSMLLTLLIFSSSLPFMIFTYFLRGIDMPSIFVLLAMGFLAIMVMVCLAIMLATLPVSKPFKVIIGLNFAFGGLPALPVLMAFAFSFLQGGGGSRITTVNFWIGAVTMIVITAAGCAVMLAISIAQVTPPAANRAKPVRLALFLQWCVTLAGTTFLVARSSDQTPLVVWLVAQTLLFTITTIAATSERHTVGPRVTNEIPANALGRVAVFPFFSGSASGLVWSALMIAASVAVLPPIVKALLPPMASGEYRDAMLWVGDYAIYLFGFALTAMAIRDVGPFTKIPRSRSWILVVLLMLMAAFIPVAGWILFGGKTPFGKDMTIWMLASPIPNPQEPQVARYIFGGIWLAIVLLLRRNWFAERFANFRRAAPAA